MADLLLIRGPEEEQASAERELTALVLNGVTSPHSRCAYAIGLERFFAWLQTQPRHGFTKAVV